MAGQAPRASVPATAGLAATAGPGSHRRDTLHAARPAPGIATAGLAATAGLCGEFPECMGINPMHSATARGWATRHGDYHPPPGGGWELPDAHVPAEPILELAQPYLWQPDTADAKCCAVHVSTPAGDCRLATGSGHPEHP